MRNDKKIFKAIAIDYKRKFKDEELVKILKSLKVFDDKKAWINNNFEKFNTFFGSHFKGEKTDWNEIEETLNSFEWVLNYYENATIPKEKLFHLDEIMDYIHNAYEEISSLEIETIYKSLFNELSISDQVVSTEFDKLIKIFEYILQVVVDFE